MSDKQGKSFSVAFAAIILIMLLGMGLIIRTYQNYQDEFIHQQETHQLELAQSVDRNIESLLRQSRNSLEYIVGMEQFRAAERQWLRSGDSRDMLLYLTENHLNRNELIAGIAVMQDGQFLLDEHGRPTYQFFDEDDKNDSRICVGVTGRYYLALICQGQGNASYASMIDLQLLYQKITSIELAEADQLLLLDRYGDIMLHYCSDSETIKITSLENCPIRRDFQLMMAAEQQNRQDCFPFLYETQKMSEGFNAHIMILPTGSNENENFAVGLISNIDTALAPLYKASFRWILGGLIVLSGICLLLILLLHFRRKDMLIEEELALLQQKNIAMEELNRKTQEVAHHQRLEMMGTLTSGIAHEFNNLLTPIMSYSILTLEQLPSEQEEIYDNILEIYNSSRKAKDIISQLLQYSRKNGDNSRSYLQPKQLLEKVLRVALPSCPKEVEVVCDLPDSELSLYGNETQLSQLFLNLLINAFHSMEQGGRLTLSAEELHGQMQISVKDSGCGIPQDVLPHIFEPFYSTKEGGKGSGLGLAIVQQIVEDHEGSIHVHSVEGEGSCFTVTLPAYHPSNQN